VRHVKTAPKDHSLAAQPATAFRRGNLPTRSSRKFDRSCAIVCIHTRLATGKSTSCTPTVGSPQKDTPTQPCRSECL
jgi:hypothetical protein